MANAPSINWINEAKISAANKGPRLKAENLRKLIAEYILNTAATKKITTRKVPCPSLADWAESSLPGPTRLRICNPDRYPDDQSAIEGEFRRVQGTPLLHPSVQAALATLGVEYSVYYPPYECPTDPLQVPMVGVRDDKETAFVCCLIPQNTKPNGWPIKQLIPGRVTILTSSELATVTDMNPAEISPFSLPTSVTTCIDSSVMKLKEVAMSGGTPETTLVMSPKELGRLPLAYTATGLALPL
ncbi:MAG TPA: YbaK/EbsC family protein [Candidatus Saccharimonadales bacterium]|nr:YbaK/EbsC family protein [Candidatus Saccharimonadales bacterium]